MRLDHEREAKSAVVLCGSEGVALEPAVVEVLARMEDDHWWFVARRRILLELIGELLPAARQRLVVDVGCGTGATAAALHKRYTCLGIDASPYAIELARRRFPEVQFICGWAPHDLRNLAGRANLFLLADVLEHVPGDFSMFAELLAAAQRGAYFVITVPADPRLWSPHDERHGHYRRYTQERLEELWRGQPVTTLLVSHFNARLYPLIRLARLVSRWRGKAAGEAGTDCRLPCAPLNRALEWIFAGEGRRLKRALNNGGRGGYASGVSLIAILKDSMREFESRRVDAGHVARPPSPPAHLPQTGEGSPLYACKSKDLEFRGKGYLQARAGFA